MTDLIDLGLDPRAVSGLSRVAEGARIARYLEDYRRLNRVPSFCVDCGFLREPYHRYCRPCAIRRRRASVAKALKKFRSNNPRVRPAVKKLT